MHEGIEAKRKAEKEKPKNAEEIQEQVVLWTSRRVLQEMGETRVPDATERSGKARLGAHP